MNSKDYKPQEREKHWRQFWNKEKIYQFDPNSTKPVFTVDTPPPTVSGALHLGHVFSYTQAEVLIRYFRMAGFNVRYPVGFDDNGLPTERLVEKEKGILGREVSLKKFQKLCTNVIKKYQKQFENLFRILGISVDWRLKYETISPEVAKLAQSVFLALFKKGLIYQSLAPALYCTECQTTVAQAEVEDREQEGVFYDVVFEKSNGKPLIIATTRPELIPACVGVFVNPADKRYQGFLGKLVKTPFGEKVKVSKDPKVQIEKGTGVVMCCTYGDETDVYWVRAHNLAEKIIIGKNGKFVKVPKIEKIAGKAVSEARELMVSELKKLGKIVAETKITHNVGVHERCTTPIEIINTKQWFVKILDEKKKLLAAANRINWYPAYMKKRYYDWVENLKWNWSISRERFFGIPIPVYVCQKCDQVILPEEDELPIDPRVKKYGRTCPKCHSTSIEADGKILDTWFTSALTPEINNQHPVNGRLRGAMYPMTMRPQAHDIIRTWAFYTIAMGQFLHNNIPWRNLAVSGHILLKKGEKISKKKGGGEYQPEELVARESADAVRYAMCLAKLGQDAYFDIVEVKTGQKLVTKILNAAQFTLSNLKDFNPKNKFNLKNLEATDYWILSKVNLAAEKMAQEFKKFEFSSARLIFEDFFWGDFCDNYLEIVKGRLYGQVGPKRRSAQFALYQTFLAIIKMLSPFMPHLTEEIYHQNNYFVKHEGAKSIHQTLWPQKVIKIDQKLEDGAKLMLAIISKVRKYKSDEKISLAAKIPAFGISTSNDKKDRLEPFIDDLKAVARTSQIIFLEQGKKPSKTDFVITI